MQKYLVFIDNWKPRHRSWFLGVAELTKTIMSRSVSSRMKKFKDDPKCAATKFVQFWLTKDKYVPKTDKIPNIKENQLVFYDGNDSNFTKRMEKEFKAIVNGKRSIFHVLLHLVGGVYASNIHRIKLKYFGKWTSKVLILIQKYVESYQGHKIQQFVKKFPNLSCRKKRIICRLDEMDLMFLIPTLMSVSVKQLIHNIEVNI